MGVNVYEEREMKNIKMKRIHKNSKKKNDEDRRKKKKLKERKEIKKRDPHFSYWSKCLRDQL